MATVVPTEGKEYVITDDKSAQVSGSRDSIAMLRRTKMDMNVIQKVQDTYEHVVRETFRTSKGMTLESQDEDAVPCWSDYAYYHTENVLASNPGSQLYALGVMFLVFLIILSLVWWVIVSAASEDEMADASDDFVASFKDTNKATNLENAFYMTLQVLMTGGFDMSIGHTSILLRFLFFIQILVGLVVFAILVGFITEMVQGFMEDLNKGKSKVTDRGHTLILGWNDATQRTVAQLGFFRRQLIRYNEEWVHPWIPLSRGFFSMTRLRASTPVSDAKIVILADQFDKEEMQNMLSVCLLERGISQAYCKVGRDIVCRVGSPTDIHNLVKVAAQHATSILIMMTEDDQNEFDSSNGAITNGATIRTLLAVRHVLFTAHRVLGHEMQQGVGADKVQGPGKGDKASTKGLTKLGSRVEPSMGLNEDLRIVVQLSAPCPFINAACFMGMNGRQVVHPVDLSTFMNGLMFSCANQPGIAKTLMDLFNFDGVAIRRRPIDAMVGGKDGTVGGFIGMTFGRVQEYVTDCVLIGVVNPDSKGDIDEGLAPRRDRRFRKGDIIIFLDDNSIPTVTEEGPKICKEAKKKAVELRHLVCKSTKERRKIETIFIGGWRQEWDHNEGRFYNTVEDLCHDVKEGSTIVFLNGCSQEHMEKVMSDIGIPKSMDNQYNCQGRTLVHVTGDPGNMDNLRPVVEQYNFNTAVVLGTQHATTLTPKSRDTRVLSILLMLRQIHDEKIWRLGSQTVSHMHVIGENQQDSTSTLALPPKTPMVHTLDPDFVNTQAISARVLVTTLAYPAIAGAISDIFDEEEGKAIIAYENCSGRIPLETDIDFSTIKQLHLLDNGGEASRSIVIGVMRSPEHGNHGHATGPIILPSEDYTAKYIATDKLIVVKRFTESDTL
jgi:hypothetical protein